MMAKLDEILRLLHDFPEEQTARPLVYYLSRWD
jgi:hypothetical protein